MRSYPEMENKDLEQLKEEVAQLKDTVTQLVSFITELPKEKGPS